MSTFRQPVTLSSRLLEDALESICSLIPASQHLRPRVVRCEIEDYQSAVVFVVVQFRWGLHDTRGPSLVWVYDTIVCWASLPLDTVQELADAQVALSLICEAIRVHLQPQFLDPRLLVHF